MMLKSTKLLINLINYGDEETFDKFLGINIFELISISLEKSQNDLTVLKYMILFLKNFIGVDKIEENLKNFIEDLAKKYFINDIGQIFTIIASEKKIQAKEIFQKVFIDFIKHEDIKRNLFDYYSHLDTIVNGKFIEENEFTNNLIIANDELKSVRKIVECIKYSEILFDF